MLLNPLSKKVVFRSGVPMLPGAFPGLGHLPAFFSEAAALIEGGRQKLGPLFYLHMGPGLGWHPTVCGQEGFELLKSKSTSNAHLSETHPQFISERGLMALEGSAHQRLRSLMNAAFSPRGLGQNGAAGLCAGAVRTLVESWAERRVVKVLPDTQRLALDVIFQMLDVPRDELGVWYEKYRHFSWSALPLPIVDRLVVKPATVWLNKKLRELAESSRNRPEGSSVLAALANARDETSARLSIDELVDNMRLLAFAGHETSASAMAWSVIELARAPQLWDPLVAEAKTRSQPPTSPSEIKELPFAEALFRETVRLHPPVPLFSRRVVKPIQFAGHEIPEGEILFIPVTDFGTDPAVFPEPHRYNPDRWLGRTSPPSSVELAAFGGGNHFCLGYHLAMLEGVQLLWTLANVMSARGAFPRLLDGAEPKAQYLPLSHPAPGTVVVFS